MNAPHTNTPDLSSADSGSVNRANHPVTLRKNHAKTLYAILSAYVGHLAQLETHLRKEREIIAERMLDQLETVLEAKEKVLVEINQLDRNITQIFKYYGIGGERGNDLDQILQHYQGPLDKELLNSWDITKKSLERCHALNQVNGKIIHHTQTYMDRLITALNGESEHTKVYHKDGKRDAQTSHRSLAKA